MEEKLIYANEIGQSIEISHSSSFFLEKYEGLGAIKNLLYTQKSINQSGVNIVGESLDIRNIIIEGSIVFTSKEDILEAKRNMIKALNPTLKGYLYYELGDFKKKIACKVESAPFPHVDSKYKKFLINLFCANPFWQDIDVIGSEIETLIGGKSWPFSFPVRFATRGEPIKNIINDGDIEAPVQIIFKGPAVNPKVTNKSTGEFIKVKRIIDIGDTLTINTEFGHKKVEIKRSTGLIENAFNYISLDSTFFQLKQGDNVIEYSTENELEPQSVTLKYTNRYLGV